MVVSSSMLRLWMVDWSMRKFTYTIDQDSMHKRYEHHISTTTIILELSIILISPDGSNDLPHFAMLISLYVTKLSLIVLNNPPLFLIIFVASKAQRIFVTKQSPYLKILFISLRISSFIA